MQCPQCGADNRDGRRFCAECGVSLAIGCPDCGFANEPGEKFCGGCGTALAGTSGAGPATAAGGGGRRIGIAAFRARFPAGFPACR